MFTQTLRSIMAGAAAIFGALLAASHHHFPAVTRANWATMRAREDRTSRRIYQGRELAELAVQSVRETHPAANWQQFLALRSAPIWSAPRRGSLAAMLTRCPGSCALSAANENFYELFDQGRPHSLQDVVVPMARRSATATQGGASA